MTTEQPNARKWVRRKDARPSEIVDAALDLFVEKGFIATKMEDIAKRAGVTKGTPYLYFANKEEIFKEVVRSSLGQRLNEGEDFIRHFEGPSSELLTQAFGLWWSWIGESRLSGIPKLVISEAGNFPELTRFYGEEVILRCNVLLERILQRGIDRGEFRAIDVKNTASVLVGPMLKALLWKHSFGCCGLEPIDIESYLRAYFDLMLHGLLSPES